MQAGSVGLAIGAAVALGCAAFFAFVGGWLAPLAGLIALLAFPVAGVVRGYLQPVSLQQAARAVDDRYELQDRALTALEAGGDSLSPAQQIQLSEALSRLRSIKPSKVVTMGTPKYLFTSLAMIAVAMLLMFFPWSVITPPPTFAAPTAKVIAPPKSPEVSASSVEPSLELRPYQHDERYRVDASLLDDPTVRRYFAEPAESDASP